eukprot:g2537.t2
MKHRDSSIIRCGQGFDPNPKPPKKSKVKKVQEDVKIMDESEARTSVQRELPSSVANRMLSRIIIFCGVPVFTGLLTLPLFYYLKATH